MKRFLRPAAFGLLLVLSVLFGLMLGKGNGLSGLWADVQSLFREKQPSLDPNDPALKAALPQPDPAAGLPPGPLNDLLDPSLTPEQQTTIVGQMLLDYWTTVRSLPNGTWQEICDQLAGANGKKLALVPKEHPALQDEAFRASPESPGIRLHVLSSSGCAFQLIYDGPDGQPYTDDDLVRNFPPDVKFK
ncbi:hypothetical protein EI77_02323 [Prosthecobacter fusiformis]|uniref:Uncharacterized protein n=1 Tax=Prosthecobacter fusiformis TaxID=48464 RepID=A0A4R7RZA6_9BACT|nr:hypothetical protein [Prosthecobacter fusiformis]TDU71201.1 hypothetical protein EI77_02323 [Prosthecobacter fusiformis]